MFWFKVIQYVFGLVKFSLIFVSCINSDLVFGLVLTSFRQNGFDLQCKTNIPPSKNIYEKCRFFSKTTNVLFNTSAAFFGYYFAAIVRPIPRIQKMIKQLQ
jgi:hypothetical protein